MPGTERTDPWPTHTRTAGATGPVIVCVHGVGVSSRYFVPTMRALKHDARLYAVDLPGFGLTAGPPEALTVSELADALLRWVDVARLHRVVLLGNSFGCQIAVEVAVRRPDAVGGLVLVGPTVDPVARSRVAQIWRLLRTAPGESIKQAPIMAQDYREAGLRRAWTTFGHAVTDRIEDKLPRVTAPALVVRGEHDRLVPQPWAEEVTRLLPRGRLVVVPGAAHSVNFTHPEALADAVRRFVRQDVTA